jgi:hypothetical protein
MIQLKREVLYNILTEFGIPMKLLRLIKVCLNETYNIVPVGKYIPLGGFMYARRA